MEVYARADSVELFVNGKTQGVKKFKNDCLFTFKVPYENGTIEAVSRDASGREIGRSRLVTAGEETLLRAEPEQTAVRPGRLAFIRLRFTDAAGTTKPAERSLLDVSVEGGRLRGLGSACPYYTLSYLGSRCDTYYGEALAMVEAGESGEIRLTASGGGYTAEARVKIEQD